MCLAEMGLHYDAPNECVIQALKNAAPALRCSFYWRFA
jgi:hypothetical protein